VSETIKVFVSSTSYDLEHHREAVIDALQKAGYLPVNMENFGASPTNAVEKCLDEVAEADWFVGIYAYRYGFIPSGYRQSITELEFDEAQRRGKPCFCFLVDPYIYWAEEYKEYGANGRKLEDFKNRISLRVVRATFTTPHDLATRVVSSLSKEERRYRRQGRLSRTFNRVLLSIWLVAVIGLAGYFVWQSSQSEPIPPSLAYEFLIDTSHSMNQPLNGKPRFEIVNEAVEQIADAPGLDTSQVWRGLRLAGGGDECNESELVVKGTNLSTDEFIAPLQGLLPSGTNAYELGIRQTFDDLADPIVVESDVKVVFIIIGSLDFRPCHPFELAVALQTYKQLGISTTICTFGLVENDEQFIAFKQQLISEGFTCVYNVETPEEISQIAVSLMQELVQAEINEEELSVEPLQTVIPTQVVLLESTDIPESTEVVAQSSNTPPLTNLPTSTVDPFFILTPATATPTIELSLEASAITQPTVLPSNTEPSIVENVEVARGGISIYDEPDTSSTRLLAALSGIGFAPHVAGRNEVGDWLYVYYFDGGWKDGWARNTQLVLSQELYNTLAVIDPMNPPQLPDMQFNEAASISGGVSSSEVDQTNTSDNTASTQSNDDNGYINVSLGDRFSIDGINFLPSFVQILDASDAPNYVAKAGSNVPLADGYYHLNIVINSDETVLTCGHTLYVEIAGNRFSGGGHSGMDGELLWITIWTTNTGSGELSYLDVCYYINETENWVRVNLNIPVTFVDT
jgi:Domain of unknown function (DUF4062)